MQETNSLAFLENLLLTDVQSFITLGPGHIGTYPNKVPYIE
jgi:hypothetical protein